MKIKSKIWLLIVLLSVSGLASCRKKDKIPSLAVTNNEVNQWIADSMRYYYYWNAQIPGDGSLNYKQSPEVFFESLLFRPADRFSWIQNRQELEKNLSGVVTTSGLELGFFSIGTNNAGATVKLVHKGSPADIAGITRGDIFVKVNGQEFQVSNGRVTNVAPIYGNAAFTLTKGVLSGNTISPGSNVTLTPVEDFQESAIHLDTVLTTSNGTKVGYLFYNRFLIEQARDLIEAFGRFKSAGVEDLIIDERYNSGGSVEVAAVLSALIHKSFDINSDFIKYKFNSNFRDLTLTYGELFGPANAAVIAANNLGLERVFLLATGESASASELLINNLRPFLGGANVVHIGERTLGKDDASITISNSAARFKGNKENDWGIQPIILKYSNSNGVGDFVEGLVPTHPASESIPFAPLGSHLDPLIGRALSIIDPSMLAMFNKTMSIRRERTSGRTFGPLKEFNRSLADPYPLDVTKSLKGKGAFKIY